MIFTPFPKIPRLRRECTITEKIDGTNAQIMIVPAAETDVSLATAMVNGDLALSAQWAIFAGSRSRWITPGKTTDNFGFAGWVRDNAEELVKLGPGQHFGEWYGAGINRGYGLTEKRFALFNTHRWNDRDVRPRCCGVVPILYVGEFNDAAVQGALDALRAGSRAAPGWGLGQAEGIVVFMHASGTMHKVTLEGDEKPKGSTE